MTAIITKRADELKPGDVVELDEKGKCSVLCVSDASNRSDNRPVIRFGRHATGGVLEYAPAGSELYLVEAPALSPAQQHAEDMAQLLRDAVNHENWQIDGDEAKRLLTKIDPPAPPTLEEALELLGEALDATRIGFEPLDRRISQFRDRARRAGVLKDGAK